MECKHLKLYTFNNIYVNCVLHKTNAPKIKLEI